MQRRKHTFEGLIMEEDATKIRKTRCSPSSSTSSIIHNHRPKKAALVGKRGAGSSTPVPTWRILGSRSPSMSLRIAAAETPRSQTGRSQMQPVSARKLAATLWELNEVPVPVPKDGRRRRRERVESLSSLLPPHLSDPSHSPVSEKSDRSGTATHHRRRTSPSLSRKQRSTNAPEVGIHDSISNASFMEIETRSRSQSQTPARSTAGYKNRLKDVSNALTTSKELLKIISRMWVQEDNQPSSSMSLISALHTELERARLQVNQLVQEKRSSSDENDINYLLQCFAEEKAAWKNKEKEAIEAAIESVTGELEVERKLRRRIESLNKKLGKELAETKAFFSNAVKEIENERKTRGIIEQVCNNLAWNVVGEDNVKVDELKRESVRMREEIEKEREMLHVADALREERAQMKLSEAKHHFEEKNAAVDQLRDELESFLKDGRGKERVQHHHPYIDDGEVEDGVTFGDDSADSDLQSIELNKNRSSKVHKSGFTSTTPRSSNILAAEDLIGRQLTCGGTQGSRGQRRSTSLLRSMSNVVESLDAEDGELGFSYERFAEAHRKSSGDDLQRSKVVKGLRQHILSSSRLGLNRNVGSPSGQQVNPWSQELDVDRSVMIDEVRSRRRQEEARRSRQ